MDEGELAISISISMAMVASTSSKITIWFRQLR
jgi:hypothetical protein